MTFPPACAYQDYAMAAVDVIVYREPSYVTFMWHNGFLRRFH